MMVEVHGPETPPIVAAYDFSPFDHIVDVGGGNGSLLSAVLAAFPGRRATLFDLAEAIAAAERGEGGPLPGVALVAGDVFTTAAPEGGDLYLIRHLMHDYDDRGLPAHSRQCAPRHAAAGARAGAGGADALRRQSRAGPLARSAGDAAVRRPRAHGRGICALFEQAGLRLARTIPTKHPAMAMIEAVAAGSA